MVAREVRIMLPLGSKGAVLVVPSTNYVFEAHVQWLLASYH